MTPLLAAALHGHLPVVNFLLQQNDVDPTVCNRDGRNALHLAVLNGHEAMVETLLDRLTLKKVNHQDKVRENAYTAALDSMVLMMTVFMMM